MPTIATPHYSPGITLLREGGFPSMSNDIIVFGDWHGNWKWAGYNLSRARDISEATEVYHVGDFGLWATMKPPSSTPPRWGALDESRFHQPPPPTFSQGTYYMKNVENALSRYNFTLNVVLGNHEAYPELRYATTLPDRTMMFAGYNHIKFLPRIHTMTSASGVSILTVGGAGSIDKSHRVPGVSWWEEEEITAEDMEEGIHRASGKAWDFMFTHECPEGVPFLRQLPSYKGASPEVEQYCRQQRVRLRHIVDSATPQVLVHGHWHTLYQDELRGISITDEEYMTNVVGLSLDGGPGNGMVIHPNGTATIF